ncbi:AAA family ATPase [Endothiovibrio diazotrophicus]
MRNEKRVFRGDNNTSEASLRLKNLPPPPPWREFQNKKNRRERGEKYQASEHEIEMVNAALYLRRPLLITGKPGAGKSSLAYAVAHELGLGDVLVWPITSKSVLQDGLYSYDAIGRLQEASLHQEMISNEQEQSLPDIGRFIRLGSIGSAFLQSKPSQPSVVLIDEIDKSDIDLPNDLLHLFEEGEFEIHELARLPKDGRQKDVEVYASGSQDKLSVPNTGLVRCDAFPLVIMTSNGEREFPPAFLRRCLRLNIKPPTEEKIAEIVEAHLQVSSQTDDVKNLIQEFLDIRDARHKEIATDQLLNAIYLLKYEITLAEKSNLRDSIFEALSDT